MGTTSIIIRKNKTTNKYQFVKCGYDGYLTGVGEALLNLGTSYDNLSELFELTFIRGIHIYNGELIYRYRMSDQNYHGNKKSYGYMEFRTKKTKSYDTVAEITESVDFEYAYLFEDDKWQYFYNYCDNPVFAPLTKEAIEKEDL